MADETPWRERLANPWRKKWLQASFRGAIFYVENGTRAGGRRVAMHEYPKRNVPYAEDMGRAANKFAVQGYLISLDGTYLTLKDDLIEALEKDGPGMLRLPLPYKMQDVKVMVQQYSVVEARERGGMCAVDMTFVEYGDPVYRSTISTPGQIQQSGSAVENNVIGPIDAEAEINRITAAGREQTVAEQASPYAQVYEAAQVSNNVPTLDPSSDQAIHSGINYG